MRLRIPHNAWVIVCDARKALFLRNEGDGLYPNLKVEQTNEAPANPRNAEWTTDRPGRMQNAVAPTSAADMADHHALAEAHFAGETMQMVEALQHSGRRHGFVLVAPPRMLAALRERVTEELRPSIIAEVDKDLTKHPVYEIERLLTAA
jgi:protein required for attachment to host cells